MFIQVGNSETLLDDSNRLADKAREEGVDVKLQIWDEMPHVWHLAAPILPEGQQARPTVSTGPDHKPNLLPDYVPVQPGRKLDPNSPAARYAQLEARAAARISAIADVCR